MTQSAERHSDQNPDAEPNPESPTKASPAREKASTGAEPAASPSGDAAKRTAAEPSRASALLRRGSRSPLAISSLAAVVAAGVLYFLQGRATAILWAGFAFFVVWCVSNIALGLPPPKGSERP